MIYVTICTMCELLSRPTQRLCCWLGAVRYGFWCYRVVLAHRNRFFWPSQRVSKHTLIKPEPSLPALFLWTIKKLPPSQRVSTLPVETLTL
jgi:hypothetical protein